MFAARRDSLNEDLSAVDYCEIDEVEDFINDKYYDIVITDYMKKKVLEDLKDTLKLNQFTQSDNNKRVIENLHNEITFLRNDSQAKNGIIQLLIKNGRNCRGNLQKNFNNKPGNEMVNIQEKVNQVNKPVAPENDRGSESLQQKINNSFEVSTIFDLHNNINGTTNDFSNMNSNVDCFKLDQKNPMCSNFNGKTTEDMKNYMVSYFLRNTDQSNVRFGQNDVPNTDESEFVSSNLDLVVDLKEFDNDDDDNDSGNCNDSGNDNDNDIGALISCNQNVSDKVKEVNNLISLCTTVSSSNCLYSVYLFQKVRLQGLKF